MNICTQGRVALVWLLALIAQPALAMTVSPTRIELSPVSANTILTVINDSTESAIQVRMLPKVWLPDDSLHPTTDLVVYPLSARIAPGQQQTFRLLLRGKPNPAGGRYFRVLVENAGDVTASGGEVKLKTGFSVPVYVEPKGLKPVITARRTGQDVTLRNDGAAYALIEDVLLPTAAKLPVGRALLPGGTLLIPLPDGLPMGAALQIDTRQSGHVAVE